MFKQSSLIVVCFMLHGWFLTTYDNYLTWMHCTYVILTYTVELFKTDTVGEVTSIHCKEIFYLEILNKALTDHQSF